MPVVCSVSLRVGHTTFFVSAIDSWAILVELLARLRRQEHHRGRRDSPASTAATRMIIALSPR